MRLVASGTLFRLPPTRECRRRANVGSETLVFALPLRGASPFYWVPWCFRVRFGRLLQLRWGRQCVAGATLILTTTSKTVAAWSLVPALALLFGRGISFHCRFDVLQDSQVEEQTGIFSLGRTRSSLAVLREVTSLLQRQERQITPRVCHCRRGPRSRLAQWQEKRITNCHRGANFLRQLTSWRSMWRRLNSNIRSLCQSHIKAHELIMIHHCAHVKNDEEEDTTRDSGATTAH